jgi:hypothetical protein
MIRLLIALAASSGLGVFGILSLINWSVNPGEWGTAWRAVWVLLSLSTLSWLYRVYEAAINKD